MVDTQQTFMKSICKSRVEFKRQSITRPSTTELTVVALASTTSSRKETVPPWAQTQKII
jgi:hypothetical protein